MTTDVHMIKSYSFRKAEPLFLDANIWLYIYGPQPPASWKQTVYSNALGNIIAAKGQIYIDALVLSEFINRFARLYYEMIRSSEPALDTFKKYRQSDKFKPIAEEIEITVRKILRHSQRVDTGFSSCDINSILNDFGKGESDFNDQMLIQLCKTHGLKIITHDEDFKGCGLTVLTANNRLI